ncbi:hypothetical protein QBC39DRAFT_139170 [Podospora conica]|nr:hypothetical protein QBC39DRAFT_139170 [Schizothecium conicum]
MEGLLPAFTAPPVPACVLWALCVAYEREVCVCMTFWSLFPSHLEPGTRHRFFGLERGVTPTTCEGHSTVAFAHFNRQASTCESATAIMRRTHRPRCNDNGDALNVTLTHCSVGPRRYFKQAVQSGHAAKCSVPAGQCWTTSPASPCSNVHSNQVQPDNDKRTESTSSPSNLAESHLESNLGTHRDRTQRRGGQSLAGGEEEGAFDLGKGSEMSAVEGGPWEPSLCRQCG